MVRLKVKNVYINTKMQLKLLTLKQYKYLQGDLKFKTVS